MVPYSSVFLFINQTHLAFLSCNLYALRYAMLSNSFNSRPNYVWLLCNASMPQPNYSMRHLWSSILQVSLSACKTISRLMVLVHSNFSNLLNILQSLLSQLIKKDFKMDVNECILSYTWCKREFLALQISIQNLIHQMVTYLSLAPLLQNFRQRRSSFRNNIHYQK